MIGIKNCLVYSVAPEGDCLSKTQKALKLFPQYALADVNGELLQDSEGNYLLSADWKTL